MAELLHIFVDEVISLNLSGVTTKSDKNYLQKYANSDTTIKTLHFAKFKIVTKSLMLGSRGHYSSDFTIFEKKIQIKLCCSHYPMYSWKCVPFVV